MVSMMSLISSAFRMGSRSMVEESRSYLNSMKSVSCFDRKSKISCLVWELDDHSLLEQHVDTAEGGLDASRVPVVEHGDIVRETFDEPDLVRSQGCTGGCRNILYPRLMHGDDVGVTLH